MSESEQDMKVRMGEAVSPEDADPCVIGNGDGDDDARARLGKKWLSLPT
jgi:hypothetical protein